MFNPQDIFSQLQSQLGQVLPGVAKAAQQDMHLHGKALVEQLVTKLDLVSREEFEIQREVPQHTRARLEALEKRVAALEAALQANPPG